MVLGINATLITLTNGTTANAPDVLTDLQNINNGGISNDGQITTDAAGTITAVGFKATGGGLQFYVISPYHAVIAATINSGNINTVTCTGVGGIPSGAKAVLFAFAFTCAAINSYATFTPSGTAQSAGNYPATIPAQISTSTVIAGSFICPLDGTGKMDVKAINGNLTSFDLQIFGYFF